MIALILLVGLAIAVVLFSIAALVFAHSKRQGQLALSIKHTDEYVQELRRRQFQDMDTKGKGTEASAPNVLQFPYPPGAA